MIHLWSRCIKVRGAGCEVWGVGCEENNKGFPASRLKYTYECYHTYQNKHKYTGKCKYKRKMKSKNKYEQKQTCNSYLYQYKYRKCGNWVLSCIAAALSGCPIASYTVARLESEAT